ncbi:ISSpo8, transposase [Rhodopseudomonas palustris HaA2]|uniref:ISSpo8, transposase n=1 Tax=Rhodopseudomonas palustris (strain HaA2) TaxID=316058 RepID=Q2IUD7_RHOP2|nr:IS1595-like element ISRpa1 family transposase [Rhodopseudomonas palustris]ABD08173.1 ISSpo8, transposase [Rhodopseudomonas palustris HaA2]
MKSFLNAKHLQNEEAAYAWVEARIWPNGPVCPHCGGVDRISKMQGKSTRIGAYKCYQCRKPFTVKVGTIFESSHVPMHLWLQAIFLLSSSKKGISSNQLHRTLGCTLKTAWFISHRVREAMRDGGLAPMGGAGGIVEVDETYFGKTKEKKPSPQRKGRPFIHRGGGPSGKRAIVSLVERGGKVRSFHVENADKPTVVGIVTANVAKESRLHTDESRLYIGADQHFSSHETINHTAKEYARGDVTTNSVEGFFSIFKRGMKGVYQHCGENHLHRYLSEYDFRYNNRVALGVNDYERADRVLAGVVGKRLTYQTTR